MRSKPAPTSFSSKALSFYSDTKSLKGTNLMIGMPAMHVNY